MQIEQRQLTDIQPYEKNAKKHPDSQVKQIVNSIREFGFNQPIVVDEAGVIIVGHGRYMAAHLLGLDTVPVLTVKLTEEQARAYRLADNKLNESDWNMELVIAELKELSLPMVELTGFNKNLVLEDEKEDVVPAEPKVARSQPGDLYQLGPHRLLCGDATKEEDFQTLMQGMKADMVFTDPPYNVNYKGRGEKTSTTIMNDKMDKGDFKQFLVKTFQNMKRSIKGGAGLYVFHSTSTQAVFEEALNENEIDVRNQLIWNKPVASMGWGDYRWKHEPFYYATVRGQSVNFYGDRTHTTVLDFQKTDQQLLAWAKRQRDAEKAGKTTIWTMKREPVSDYVHPTQKPVELITYALENSSKTDDIVLDPFLGSGSTLIACEKNGRACFGLELDPKFVDVIVERWVQYTKGDDNEEQIVIKNGEEIVW